MLIQSIDRAQKILSLFSFDRPRLGIMEIAKELGLGKGTVHNIVKTLCSGGLLQQEPDTRKYMLGTKLFTLGMVVAGTMELNQKARPAVRQLARETNLTSRIAIWDNDAALITMEFTPKATEPFALQIGPRVEAYCSSIGRVLLVHLPQTLLEKYLHQVEMKSFTDQTIIDRKQLVQELDITKSRGYALNNQEISLGRVSIAAAIFNNNGSLAGAISISGRPKSILETKLEPLLDKLWETARGISQSLGYYR